MSRFNEFVELVGDWDFSKDAKPQGSSDGFWYDLTDGGYIDIKAVLKHEDQIKKLQDAIDVVHSFEIALEREGLLNEF